LDVEGLQTLVNGHGGFFDIQGKEQRLEPMNASFGDARLAQVFKFSAELSIPDSRFVQQFLHFLNVIHASKVLFYGIVGGAPHGHLGHGMGGCG